MSDWSKLQFDVLRLIARRLHLAEDYVRFGAVCKSWHSIFLEKDHSCSLLPWVLVNENEQNGTCEFCCPFSKKLYELYLPEIIHRRRWGSPFGWLVTLNKNYQMYLVNPISRAQIPLPPLHECSNIKNPVCGPIEFQEEFVFDALLSSSPFSRNCVVLAVYGDEVNRRIAFSRLGDTSWTPLQCSFVFVDDVMYFEEKFYVLDYANHVMRICDSNGIHFKTIGITHTYDAYEHDYFVAFIVELCGQVHVILKIVDFDYTSDTFTGTFEVLKLDIYTEKLEEVKNLGNWSIFIGDGYCFSVSTFDHPECSSNCIYLTDSNDDPKSATEIGVYRLDTREIEPLLEEELARRVRCIPVWMKPVFW